MGSIRRAKKDKVCDMCGNMGYPEYIVTCCRCKKASEHIYCMHNQLYEVPELWYCEVCLVIPQVVHNGEVQDCSNFEKTNSPVERIPPLNVMASCAQISGDGKQLIETPKSLSHKSSFKAVETGKVKFIPAEEIVLLRSGVKFSGKRGGLGAASCRTDQANIKSPRVFQRNSSCLSKLPSSTESKVLSQPNEGSVDAAVMSTVTIEHANNDEKGKIQRNISSGEEVLYSPKKKGEEVLSVLCKEKSVEGSVGAVVHIPSSKRTRSAEPEVEEALVGPIVVKPTGGYVNAEEVSPSEYIRSMELKCVDSGFQHTTVKKEKMEIGNFVEQKAIIRPTGDHATSPEARHEKSGFQEMDLHLTLLISPEEKHSNRPAPQACWKGAFEVFDVVSHVYDGIQAHFPARVSHKAYEILKRMPEKLKFKTVPRMCAWPHTFLLDPPIEDDIGIYFFPCKHERLKEKYIRLLERIDSHDFAMKSYVGDIELLMFTSKQLQPYSQSAETYLWGIFRHMKRKRPVKHPREHMPPPCSPAEKVDMKVDMVGGTEIRKMDEPSPRFDSPPGFAKPISKDADHLKKSLVKLPLKEVAGPILVDFPPGFSRLASSEEGSNSPEFTHKSPAFSRKKNGDLVSSSTGECYGTSASKACKQQSKQYQMADRHIPPRLSSPCTTDIPSLTAKRKWICAEEVKKENMEIKRTSSTMNDHLVLELPSREIRHAAVNGHFLQKIKAEPIEVRGSNATVSDKFDTMESQRELTLKRKQPSLASTDYDSPPSSSPFSMR